MPSPPRGSPPGYALALLRKQRCPRAWPGCGAPGSVGGSPASSIRCLSRSSPSILMPRRPAARPWRDGPGRARRGSAAAARLRRRGPGCGGQQIAMNPPAEPLPATSRDRSSRSFSERSASPDRPARLSVSQEITVRGSRAAAGCGPPAGTSGPPGASQAAERRGGGLLGIAQAPQSALWTIWAEDVRIWRIGGATRTVPRCTIPRPSGDRSLTLGEPRDDRGLTGRLRPSRRRSGCRNGLARGGASATAGPDQARGVPRRMPVSS